MVSGTVQHPEAEITIDVANPAALGEQLDRLRAAVHYTRQSVALTGGEAGIGPGKLLFTGAFNHPENDWKNGDLRASLNAQGVSVSRIAAFKKLYPTADATVETKATVEARLERGGLALRTASGDVSARGVTIDGEPVAVRQGPHLGLTFHPEMTGDDRIHQLFLEGVGRTKIEDAA